MAKQTKYIHEMCPVVKKEVLLTVFWYDPEIGSRTRKEIHDCDCSNECEVEKIEITSFVYNWDECHFINELDTLGEQ